jgi:hypothetical protein
MSIEYISGDCVIIQKDECRPNPYVYGYGKKIPTPYKVIFFGNKRKYSVWAISYSNVASYYIQYKGKALFIPYIDLT